jgi:hypothetical protein
MAAVDSNVNEGSESRRTMALVPLYVDFVGRVCVRTKKIHNSLSAKQLYEVCTHELGNL